MRPKGDASCISFGRSRHRFKSACPSFQEHPGSIEELGDATFSALDMILWYFAPELHHKGTVYAFADNQSQSEIKAI